MHSVQDEHAVRQTEIRRILTLRKPGFQRAASDVERLAEAVESGFRIHFRPEDVDDLLAVQRVAGLDRQQLDQGLGASPWPVGYGLRSAGALDAESAKKSHAHGRDRV